VLQGNCEVYLQHNRKPLALPRFWQAASAPLRLNGTSSKTSSKGA
jgi:hypothetical protein